jgi:hypothetical protein
MCVAVQGCFLVAVGRALFKDTGGGPILWQLSEEVCTILKVYMELGSYFLFLQEQIKDIVIRCHVCDDSGRRARTQGACASIRGQGRDATDQGRRQVASTISWH